MGIRKQSAWGLWWLCAITFGIYYIVWYGRINREICAVLGREVPFDGKAVATILPLINIIGLMSTASRLDEALQRSGSTERVSGGKALLSAFWFASQTRYLQRRLNLLADPAPSAAAAPAPAPA